MSTNSIPLMMFPREIRDGIYEAALHPGQYDEDADPFFEFYAAYPTTDPFGTNHALLQVGGQVDEEAVRAMYRVNLFVQVLVHGVTLDCMTWRMHLLPMKIPFLYYQGGHAMAELGSRATQGFAIQHRIYHRDADTDANAHALREEFIIPLHHYPLFCRALALYNVECKDFAQDTVHRVEFFNPLLGTQLHWCDDLTLEKQQLHVKPFLEYFYLFTNFHLIGAVSPQVAANVEAVVRRGTTINPERFLELLRVVRRRAKRCDERKDQFGA
ncbi:hypothetical protein GGR52DRAFT_26337 [Hypoxylon sp. FL1284]|nr:hypothetical protein GGR52DRAFT_26337 [Hypoxylon sp. FL1284]